MDAHIVTSNRIPSAFHFIGNRIAITDNLCIAAINDCITLTGNICIDILYVLIRIRDGIPVAICYSRIIRSQYRRISHSTESQQSGDDDSYGRLTKISLPVYICTYKFTLTGRFVLAFR